MRRRTRDRGADCRDRAAGRTGQHGSANRGSEQGRRAICAIRLHHLRGRGEALHVFRLNLYNDCGF